MMKNITERTALPISLILVLGGGVVWMTNVYARVEANTLELSRVRSQMELLSQIDRKLAVIETEIRLIKQNTSPSKDDQ